MNRIYRWGAAVALLALVFTVGSFARRAVAQAPPPSGRLVAPKDPSPLYVVIFTDITPENVGAGTALVKQYVLDTKKEPGIIRCELLAQSDRTNHFIILQVWQNTAAFEKHESSPRTKEFRTQMQPFIGAPFDERLHFQVE